MLLTDYIEALILAAQVCKTHQAKMLYPPERKGYKFRTTLSLVHEFPMHRKGTKLEEEFPPTP